MTRFSTPATLDDPLYYLRNFEWVLDWVHSRYRDLLPEAETAFIEATMALPEASRGLLVRMVMRKGDLFRPEALRYVELGPWKEAAGPLFASAWLIRDPIVDLESLFRLFTWPALKATLGETLAAAQIPLTARKGDALAALQSAELSPRSLSGWGFAPEALVQLTVMPQCDRLRWLFFGNAYQDWSEFVLTELGLYQYEPVIFDERSRPVHQRTELETFWQLQACRQQWQAEESPDAILPQLPPEPDKNPWLARHYHRLLFKLARHWERLGELERARETYRRCTYPGARGRLLRVLERQEQYQEALDLALTAEQAPQSEAEMQQLERVLPRLRRKLSGKTQPRTSPVEVSSQHLILPQAPSVEQAVATWLSRPEAPVYYAENTLITGLFGLLCWEPIFEPLPGAFFHPFQRGPADLYWSDFVERREAAFQRCLAQLETGTHRETIVQNFTHKWGRQSPFLHWGVLSDELVSLALDCIPAQHLKLCFQRLMRDLKANRAGLPDLIQFWPEQRRYQLIEVKGPGDRLQDNQKRWLAFFQAHEIPVSVTYVSWGDGSGE